MLFGGLRVGIFATGGPHILGLHFVAAIGFGLSVVFGAWLMVGVIRSGRL